MIVSQLNLVTCISFNSPPFKMQLHEGSAEHTSETHYSCNSITVANTQKTYSEPGPFLSLYDFKIHLLTHVLLTKTPAGRYYSYFTDGLSNLPMFPQQCRLFLRFDLMSIHCSCDGPTNAMFAYIPSISSYRKICCMKANDVLGSFKVFYQIAY